MVADLFSTLFSPEAHRRFRQPASPLRAVEHVAPSYPVVAVSELPALAPRYAYDTGDKWADSYGPTFELITDYEILRLRSIELFETNLYARAAVLRLVTSEVNTGLILEATPYESVLGKEARSLTEWSERTEDLFDLWSLDKQLCDFEGKRTLGQLQQAKRFFALIDGDILVVLRQHPRSGLPSVQLIRAARVRTPMDQLLSGKRIEYGVELDNNDRHVAYHVTDLEGNSTRIPALDRNGRVVASLNYGTPFRCGVRGRPLLGVALQSLKEIDRYRDSTQRKATLASMFAAWIHREAPKGAGSFASGTALGAVRAGSDAVIDTKGTQRSFRVTEHIPGYFVDELNPGEELKAFNSTGTDEKFGDFEAAILRAVAMALEIPPEVFFLSFNKAFSASQAARSEFGGYLDRVREGEAADFCRPLYEEWALSAALGGVIDGRELLEAWRDQSRRLEFRAWVASDWAGQIKLTTDLAKAASGYEKLLANCLITHRRATRELGNGKFGRNVQEYANEIAAIAKARAPLLPQTEPAVAEDTREEDDGDADESED